MWFRMLDETWSSIVNSGAQGAVDGSGVCVALLLSVADAQGTHDMQKLYESTSRWIFS